MLEMIAALLGVIAFVWAYGARSRLRVIEGRLQDFAAAMRTLETEVGALRVQRSGAPGEQTPEPAAETIEAEPIAELPAEPEPAPTATPAEPDVPELAPTPASATTLEERLGTRWAVWLGGLALALGGLLLVRYSIEQGVFGPGVRVALGALLSLALVVAGEWFRRSEGASPVQAIAAAHVPSVLTAAGTATAFGTVYAAHALYGFIGPAAAFFLLGLIGIATMVAAALHGPALAGLGLAGSLVVPMLVSSSTPSPWPLVTYLAIVAAAAMALARLRRWLWLATAVVAGAFVWGLALLTQVQIAQTGLDAGPWSTALFVHVTQQLALAAGFMALEPYLATPDEEATPDWIAAIALAALSGLAVLALGAARFDAQWGSFATVVMAILALTAWRSAPAATAAVLAGVVALGAIAVWPGLAAPPDPRLLAPAVAGVLRLPDNVSAFLVFAATSTLAIAGLATLRLWRGPSLPMPTAGLYALAGIVPPLLALVLAYLRVTQFDRSISFAAFSVVLGAMFYLVAHRFANVPAEQQSPLTRLGVGCYAAAATACATLAFVMVLDRGYLTVAFAVTALTTSVFAVRHRIGLLRYVVAVLGFIVLGRLVWDPRIMGADLGSVPIFNWLLLGYGVPAVAFLAAARILRGEREDLAVRICDALGVLFAGLLVFFQIRHALNRGDPLANASSHIEQGLFALMSIGFAYALMRLDLGRHNPVFRFASLAFGVLSAGFIVFGLGVAANPLLNIEPILGVPVFSSLLLAYLLPGIAAVLLARASRGVRPGWYVLGAAIFAMLLLFAYVTLEVRHLFQGRVITLLAPADAAEVWSYSAAWLALGLAFLAYGVWRGSREARLASAALVVVSVIKVAFYDLTGITGLWRALSVIVLGAVLIGIGLVYQRLIFAKPRSAPDRVADEPKSS
jgi:uncharacterized membrane protein